MSAQRPVPGDAVMWNLPSYNEEEEGAWVWFRPHVLECATSGKIGRAPHDRKRFRGRGPGPFPAGTPFRSCPRLSSVARRAGLPTALSDLHCIP